MIPAPLNFPPSESKVLIIVRSDCKTATRLNASEVVSQQGGTLAGADGVPAQLVEGAQLLEGDLPDVLEDGPDHVLGAGRGRQRSAVPERVTRWKTI